MFNATFNIISVIPRRTRSIRWKPPPCW